MSKENKKLEKKKGGKEMSAPVTIKPPTQTDNQNKSSRAIANGHSAST